LKRDISNSSDTIQLVGAFILIISRVLSDSPVYVLSTIDLLEWWFPLFSLACVKMYNLLASYFSEIRSIKNNPGGATESTAGLWQ